MSVSISLGMANLYRFLGVFWEHADATVAFEDGVVDIPYAGDTRRTGRSLNILAAQLHAFHDLRLPFACANDDEWCSVENGADGWRF